MEKVFLPIDMIMTANINQNNGAIIKFDYKSNPKILGKANGMKTFIFPGQCMKHK